MPFSRQFLRSGPGLRYDKISDPLDNGSRILVIKDIENGWKEIKAIHSNGKTIHDFVNGKYLKVNYSSPIQVVEYSYTNRAFQD